MTTEHMDSIPHLSPEQVKKLEHAVRSVATNMFAAKDLTAQNSEIAKAVSEELGIEKSVITDAARQYFKQNTSDRTAHQQKVSDVLEKSICFLKLNDLVILKHPPLVGVFFIMEDNTCTLMLFRIIVKI